MTPGRRSNRRAQLYARGGVTALEPLGFNNTFAILVRTRDARRLGLRSIDDLRAVAGTWTPGFGYEFLQRADGYPGLVETYGLTFRRRSARDGSVPHLQGAGGRPGRRDRGRCHQRADRRARSHRARRHAPLLPAVRRRAGRPDVCAAAASGDWPSLGAASSGRVTERDMRAMNRAVDLDRRDPDDVAREFLARLE